MPRSGIRYTRASDHDVGALAMPDYSSVTSSKALGKCLCFINPREQTLHDRKAAVLDRQRRRRQLTWQLAQRRFLIKQVFEKDLVPETEQTTPIDSCLDVDGVSPSADAEYYLSVSPCVSPRAELPRSLTLPDVRVKASPAKLDKALAFDGIRKSGVDSVEVLPPIAEIIPDSATLTRSRSLAEFHVHRYERPFVSSYRFQPFQLPPLAETDRENDPSGTLLTRDVQSSLSPVRPRKRTLRELRRNPDRMFPKMHFLIEHGPTEAEADERGDNNAGDDIHDAREKGDIAKRSHVKADSANMSEKDRYVKLIQKVATYLPDHLVQSAHHKIRKMTNSDAIYQQKQRLLSREREKLNINDNQKWKQLEGTLSPRKPRYSLF